jgi:hypothetical protein
MVVLWQSTRRQHRGGPKGTAPIRIDDEPSQDRCGGAEQQVAQRSVHHHCVSQ